MVKKEKETYVIKAVSHALDLLEQFFGNEDELGVTELSNRLKLHKNNVFRLLATLETRGYIEQNKETDNYRLGLKTLELGQTFISQLGILKQAKPTLKEIVDKCNETASISIIRDRAVVYLDEVPANQTVQIVSRVGARLPLHCTAAGKAQIAFESESELEKLFPSEELPRYTKNTITSRTKLFEELARIAELGYALDNEEYEDGVRCIGVPIKDYTRRVVGGISISGPAFRIHQERIEKDLIPLILKAGKDVSTRLGF